MPAKPAREATSGLVRLSSYASFGVLAVAGSLIVATLVPLAFGWSPSVVLSGSMRPGVNPGDVVMTAPATPERFGAGQLIRFVDPGQPDRHLVHRIVEVKPDGTLVTKGDANSVSDSRAVPAAGVTGIVRLRVPWVGLPRLWWEERRYPYLAGLAAALLVMVFFVRLEFEDRSFRPVPRHRQRRRPRHQPRHRVRLVFR
jgi:signal peptidase I